MQYPDESDVAFWQRREAEEREIADKAIGEARIAHTTLADSYAALIAQATGEEREEA